MKKTGQAVVLRVYLGGQSEYGREPVADRVLAKAKELRLAGATVIRGISGYGAHGDREDPILESYRDDQPVIIELVDTEDNLGRLLPFLDEAVECGLVTIETIRVIRYSHAKITQF